MTLKQDLELKEAQLKADKERLEIETALAIANAKIKVYKECEEHEHQGSVSVSAEPKRGHEQRLQEDYEHGENRQGLTISKPRSKYMASRHEPHDLSELPGARPKRPGALQRETQPFMDSLHSDDETRDLYRVMQRQTDLTEMLAKNQQLTLLPQKDVPLFHGDPLEFRSFVRAFENAIVSRADSSADKLYFLEQYTRGEPRDLVKSCQHMPAERGYKEAM